MRGTSAEETLRSKEAYERLSSNHGARVCAYMAHNGRFAETQFKGSVQTFEQHICYYGMVYRHQDKIIELRIKEPTLCIHTLLLHGTILWT